jgi:DNA-binding response OmpR family regulator
MDGISLLEGKRILVVDDEPDILETLRALLSICDVVTASSFKEAKELLEAEHFDIAILDIMGVNGYELLKISDQRNVIAIMLTAHALSPDDLARSFNEGAAHYVPKDKMGEITTYLTDILEAKEKGKSLWWRWQERFASYFDRKYGPDWQKRHGIAVR